jgi:hypothetical protein
MAIQVCDFIYLRLSPLIIFLSESVFFYLKKINLIYMINYITIYLRISGFIQN